MIKNKYRVPAKQWKRWSVEARSIFNKCYDFVMDNQELLSHPGSPKLKPYHWKTLSWNMAWVAADAFDNSIPTN